MVNEKLKYSDERLIFQGMRIALNESEFIDQLNAAKSEARKSFNDDCCVTGKISFNVLGKIQHPSLSMIPILLHLYVSHVEVQVFGDMHQELCLPI